MMANHIDSVQMWFDLRQNREEDWHHMAARPLEEQCSNDPVNVAWLSQ